MSRHRDRTRQPRVMDIETGTDRSTVLEVKYLEARHQEALVVKDEDIRRQQVQVVLFQEEGDRLKNQVSKLDGRLNQLTSKYQDVCSKLDHMNERCREQEKQLRLQSREHSALRAELLSLNSVTQDSTKVLAEKLALSREIAVLKPELDHLKSQLEHQKEVFAEKLSLERQLNALEVELANEKRAAQRAAQRQECHDSDAEDRLLQRVQELEKKLASEKRARGKTECTQTDASSELQQKVLDLEARLEREKHLAEQRIADETRTANDTAEKLHKKVEKLQCALEEEKKGSQRKQKAFQTELAECKGREEALEKRLGELKDRLRETREELRSACSELAAASAAGTSVRDSEKPTEHSTKAASTSSGTVKQKTAATKLQTQPQRKRRAEELSGPEPILETPGGGGDGRSKRFNKKRALLPNTIVEKSTFSITPFLNKTTNLVDDSVMDEAPYAAGEDEPAMVKPATDDNTEQPELDAANAEASIRSSGDAESLELVTSKKKMVDAVEPLKRRGRPPKEKVLSEVSASERNVIPPPSGFRKNKDSSTTKADESAESRPTTDGQRNLLSDDARASDTAEAPSALTSTAAQVLAEKEPKKKKKMILGASSKTLFGDDDEGDDGGDRRGDMEGRSTKSKARKAASTAAAPVSGLAIKRMAKPLGSTRPAIAGGVGKRTVLSGVRNALSGAAGGGFSPLKRDRRGVNASFLA